MSMQQQATQAAQQASHSPPAPQVLHMSDGPLGLDRVADGQGIEVLAHLACRGITMCRDRVMCRGRVDLNTHTSDNGEAQHACTNSTAKWPHRHRGSAGAGWQSRP